jgi:alkylation response protein AidB-like acyl-CoA dehydrogenase
MGGTQPAERRVNFAFSDEEQLLCDTARAFAREHFGPAAARAALAGTFDLEGAWKEMAGLGWLGLLVPEEHFSDMCVVLARTAASGPRHRGSSAFIVDMGSPGVSVRPIAMFNGTEEFCEIAFDDVAVPGDALVGRPGQGWEIAMSMLTYERGPVDIGLVSKFQGMLARLQALARERGSARDPSVRRVLADDRSRALVLGLPVLALGLDLRRHRADPARHPPDARARTAALTEERP